MPLRVSLKKHFFARSERVKGVDFHPSEPFLLSALYDGRLQIHDYVTHALIKEIEVSPLPLRTAKFIVKRQWVICGGDDCALRVFNIHTLEKVKELSNAHGDYIRHVSVHSSKPLVLSSSDDMTIKLWSYERSWQRLATYEQHTHYVMQTQWHPRDPNLFASCSLDRTIKVWGLVQQQSTSSTSSSASTSSGGGGGQGSQQQQQGERGGGTVVSSPHFTLVGHERGVNCIEYSKNGERPYIVSGSDDCTVRVWDYQTKQCIQVLTGHTRNVCAVLFTSLAGQHMLPLLFSAGEDTQLFVWHGLTYKKETTIDLSIDRIWSLSLLDTSAASTGGGGGGGGGSGGGGSGGGGGSSVGGGGGGLGGLVLAIGSDSGTLVLKMGKEQPVASLHSGKAVVARGFEILQANLRLLEEENYRDGERLPVAYKDLGQCEIFPQSISHHPNGRFIAVCGDGEYVIYTAQALRNKKFGKCVDFVWSSEGSFAIKEETGRIRVHTNFVETFNFTPPFPVENIWGGALLALKASDDSFVCFYDWEACRLVRRIDVVGVQQMYWSPTGTFVSLFTSDKIYILRHDKYAVMAANTTQAKEEEGGIEIAFDLVDQISEAGVNGLWISEALIYTTSQGRIKSWCGGRVELIYHINAAAGGAGAGRAGSSFLLGYVAEQNRLYLIDRDLGLSACTLHAAFIDYKVAISNQDFDAAQEFLPLIPSELHDGISKFLFSKGFKEESLSLAKDDELRFDIALSLGKLEMCAELIRASQRHPPSSSSSSDLAAVTAARWKRLGDVALEIGNLPLAASCFHECRDFNSLLLLYSSSGDAKNLLRVGRKAAEAKNFNVAFLAYALTQKIDQCVDVLCAAGRFPEASLFARSYAPSRASGCVEKWKQSLFARGHRKAKLLQNTRRFNQPQAEGGGEGKASHKKHPATQQQQQHQGRGGGGGGFTSGAVVEEEEDLRGQPADPALQPEKFGNLEDAVEAEKILRERYSRVVPASSFPTMRQLLDFDILREINERGIQHVRNELLFSSSLDEILEEEEDQQKRFEGREKEKSLARHREKRSHPQQSDVEDLLTGGAAVGGGGAFSMMKRQDGAEPGVGESLINGNSSKQPGAGAGGREIDVSSLDATSAGGPPPDLVYRQHPGGGHHRGGGGAGGGDDADHLTSYAGDYAADVALSNNTASQLPPSSSSSEHPHHQQTPPPSGLLSSSLHLHSSTNSDNHQHHQNTAAVAPHLHHQLAPPSSRADTQDSSPASPSTSGTSLKTSGGGGSASVPGAVEYSSSASGESSRFLTLQNLRQHEIEGGGERASNIAASDIRSTVTERSSYSGVLSLDGGVAGGGLMMSSISGSGSSCSGGGGGGGGASGLSVAPSAGNSSGTSSFDGGVSPEFSASMEAGGGGGGGEGSMVSCTSPLYSSHQDPRSGLVDDSRRRKEEEVEGGGGGGYQQHQHGMIPSGSLPGDSTASRGQYRPQPHGLSGVEENFVDQDEDADDVLNSRSHRSSTSNGSANTVGNQQGHHPPHPRHHLFDHPGAHAATSGSSLVGGGAYGTQQNSMGVAASASTQQHPRSCSPNVFDDPGVDSRRGSEGCTASSHDNDGEYSGSSATGFSSTRQNVLLGGGGGGGGPGGGMPLGGPSSSTQTASIGGGGGGGGPVGAGTAGARGYGGLNQSGGEEGRRNLVQGDYRHHHTTPGGERLEGGDQAVSAGNAGAQFLQDDFVDVLPPMAEIGGGGDRQRIGGEGEEGSEFSFSDIEP